MDLRKKALWLFDVDNTLIQDVEHPKPFPDALRLADALLKTNRTLGVLTNVGRLSARQVNQALTTSGFRFNLDKVFTAGAAAAAYVRNRTPGARCFVISEGGVIEDFLARGLDVTNSPPVSYVAVGADRGLTFERLNFAARMVSEGASLLCISGSRSYPGVYLGREGVFIGEASIVAAIEHSTGKKAVVIGKPMKEMFVESAKALGFAPEQCVMVGDNPDSDIAGARAAGITSILVNRDPDNIVEFDSQGLDKRPDLTVNSLEDVMRLL